MSGAPAASTAPRRILSIWLPSLAIDRWRLVMGEQARALADAPLVLISDTAHGPRIEAVPHRSPPRRGRSAA